MTHSGSADWGCSWARGRGGRRVPVLVLAGISWSMLACGAAPGPSESTSMDQADLEAVRAFDVPRSVGLVGYATTPDPVYYPYSFVPVGVGTLVGERALVTSVTWPWSLSAAYGPLVFSYGQDPLAAEHTLRIVDIDVAPPSASWKDFEGDFDGRGGVGILHLEQAPVGMTPLDIASLGSELVNKRFAVASLDSGIGSARIAVGGTRLLATKGPGFPAMFDDFWAFARWLEASRGAAGEFPPGPAERRRLRRLFAGTEPVDETRASVLDAGREALVRPLPNQPSLRNIAGWGDGNVGAPLLRSSGHGAPNVYGVWSSEFSGVTEDSVVEQFALDFKTFAADGVAFLKAASKRQDPCVVLAAGDHCDDYKLRTCSANHRTESTTNCRWEVGNFDATCQAASAGTPSCVLPP